jgi:hypothetical protein
MDVPVQYVSFKTGEDIYFVPAKTREPLEPDLLYRRCDITRFAFATTAELQDLPEFVGYTAPSVGDTINFERVKVANFEEIGTPSATLTTASAMQLSQGLNSKVRPFNNTPLETDWVIVNASIKADRSEKMSWILSCS